MHFSYSYIVFACWTACDILQSTSATNNTVTVVNVETARLNCSRNGTLIYWFNDVCGFAFNPFCPPGNVVYDGYQLSTSFPRPTFDVATTTSIGATAVDLIIKPTTVDDGNIYVCGAQNTTSAYIAFGVHLIVLGNATELTTSLSASNGSIAERDTFTVTCSISFSGLWPPSIKFIDETRGQTFTGSALSSSAGQVIYKLTLVASSNFQGSIIRCRVYFDVNNMPPSSHPMATNVPNPPDIDSGTTPPINVIVRKQLREIVRRCIQAATGLATASLDFSVATLVSTGIMLHKPTTCSSTCQFAQLAVAAGGVALFSLSSLIPPAVSLANCNLTSNSTDLYLDAYNWAVGNLVIHAFMCAVGLVFLIIIIIIIIIKWLKTGDSGTTSNGGAPIAPIEQVEGSTTRDPKVAGAKNTSESNQPSAEAPEIPIEPRQSSENPPTKKLFVSVMIMLVVAALCSCTTIVWSIVVGEKSNDVERDKPKDRDILFTWVIWLIIFLVGIVISLVIYILLWKCMFNRKSVGPR